VTDQPGLTLLLLAGPATRLLGDLRGHFLAERRQRMQDRLDDLLDDVEPAHLVAGGGPQPLEHLGVKRRTVRRDAGDTQAAPVQLRLEIAQKGEDVVLCRVVVEDPEGQAIVPAVVHNREDAEGTVVDLIDSQVGGEAGQRLVEVGGLDAAPLFFPRPPRPSSGWWRRGRRRGGRATGANWRPGRAGRLRPPGGQPSAGRGGCKGTWAGPGHIDRR